MPYSKTLKIHILSKKSDKVNNSSQEMHDVTPDIEIDHIKGKNNIWSDSLSRLRYLGLDAHNGPEDPGQEYSASIF